MRTTHGKGWSIRYLWWTTNGSLSLMRESRKTQIYRDRMAENDRKKGSHQLPHGTVLNVSSVKLLIHNHVFLFKVPLDRLNRESDVDATFLHTQKIWKINSRRCWKTDRQFSSVGISWSIYCAWVWLLSRCQCPLPSRDNFFAPDSTAFYWQLVADSVPGGWLDGSCLAETLQ